MKKIKSENSPYLGKKQKLLLIMKLTFLLTVVCFLHTSATVYSQATKFSFELKNQRIQDVLREIEKNSDFRFFYQREQVDVEQIVNLNITDKTVEEILPELFTGQKVVFDVRQDNLILIKPAQGVIESSTEFYAQQQNSISGKVTDSNNQPLPGVTVLVKGSSNGTVTNADGFYTLSNIPENATLQFSFVGMKTQEIVVGDKTSVNLVLHEETIGLEDVVVVGYGIQGKRDVTGSILSVNSETLKRTSSSGNISQSLRGIVPGLNVTVSSSSAEQTASINIRGVKSINASSSPLIILDGVPFNGALSEIPSDDVKSIEVLKDASSSSIYGSRGANGVIIITTQEGKKGKPYVSVSSRFGFIQIAEKPDVFDATEFYNHKKEYGTTFTQTEIDNYAAGINTDWIDIITQLGKQQEHTLSVSGGGEKSSFFVSGNILQTKGVAKNDEFNRYTLRLKYENELTPWLIYGNNNSMIYLNRDGVTANFGDAFYMNPLLEVYNADGSIKLRPWPEDPYHRNPLEGLNVDNVNRDYKLFSINYFDIKIPFIKGLNYRLNTGIDFNFRNIENYWGMKNTVTGMERNGYSSVQNIFTTGYTIENILNYKKEINNHNFFVTGLYSFEKTENKNRRLDSEGFTGDVLTTYQENSAKLLTPTSGYVQASLMSLMLRFNYSYKSKYLVTTTIRRDGYSGFGKDTKYGDFPSVALGYNISEEGFMDKSWLDQLKLRASWGKNGNQAISPYSTLSKMKPFSYLGGTMGTTTAPGYVPSALENPLLGWETTTTINLGTDFSLFKGALSGSIDIFKAQVSDLLLKRKISTVFGIPGSSIMQNIGETENKGYEVALKYNVVNTKKIDWIIDFNISGSKNKIVELYGDGADDIVNTWFIGKPIKVFYGYAFDGIWQKGDDIANSPTPSKKPGDVKVRDVSSDGVIKPDDRIIQGSVFPDYRANLNSYFRYGNFSLNMMFNSVVGIKKPNNLGDPSYTWDYRRNNGDYWNYWTEAAPNNNFPANKNGVNLPQEVLFIDNASFIRLRDIKITYDLKNDIPDVWKIKELSVFVNIDNVFTLTKWNGIDPELEDQTSIPLQRTYLLGLNLKF